MNPLSLLSVRRPVFVSAQRQTATPALPLPVCNTPRRFLRMTGLRARRLLPRRHQSSHTPWTATTRGDRPGCSTRQAGSPRDKRAVRLSPCTHRRAYSVILKHQEVGTWAWMSTCHPLAHSENCKAPRSLQRQGTVLRVRSRCGQWASLRTGSPLCVCGSPWGVAGGTHTAQKNGGDVGLPEGEPPKLWGQAKAARSAPPSRASSSGASRGAWGAGA